MAHVLVAGVSTRAIAESAARAGLTVTALDAFGDLDQHPAVRAVSLPRDCGVPFRPAAVVRIARGVSCDAVAYLSPFENHPARVEALARGRRLWGNGADVLRRVRDPLVLMAALRAGGFRTPATHRSQAPLVSGEFVVKPVASGGGHGVRGWVAGTRVPPRAVLQEFIPGEPGSIVFVAAAGAAMPLGMARQLVGDAAFGAGGFRYCGSLVAPSGREEALGFGPRIIERARALAGAVTAAFGLVGLNGLDFVAHGDDAVPIEVNPRWSASMEVLDRCSASPLFQMHMRACASGTLPATGVQAAPSAVLGKAIVFAREPVAPGDTRPWLERDDVRDVPPPGQPIAAGGPVCTVFAGAGTREACYGALVARAQGIYAELWRRDE